METTLYQPVKAFLTSLDLPVKGEVLGCDVVALDGPEAVWVVIAELKETFTLELVLQGVERTAVGDEIWLAVRASERRRGREYDRRVAKLCRYLGFGLMAVKAETKSRYSSSLFLGDQGEMASDGPGSLRSIGSA